MEMEIHFSGFITALAVSAAIIWYLTKSRKCKGDPVSWPIVGMMPSLIWNLSNAYEWAAEIVIRNGGTFAFKGPFGSKHFFEVVTSSPRNLEYILKDDFTNFPRGPSFKSVFFDIFGDGLFVADEEPWKRQRKATAIAMSSASFRDQNINQIQRLVLERLIPILEESCKNKSSLDLQDILLRLNFDDICLTISGKDVGFLLPNLPEVPFAGTFDEAIESCTYRLITPPFLSKVMKFLNVGFERKHRRAMAIILEYASELVTFKMAELKKLRNENRAHCGDILSTFIHLETQEGRSPTLESVRDLCLSIILAARDTSSLALSWFFWLLTQHPDVEIKILSELYQILKAKFSNYNPNYDFNTFRFSHDDLKGMQYLHAALSEAMRLYPPVPLSYRQAVRDVFLPDGTYVKKGSKLLYFIYATNRMESVWGKDCREFKPERWIDRDAGICRKESDYKYPVFNAGPRLCLGRELAYFSMKCVAANVLLRYRMRIDPEHPVKPKFGLTMFMEHGLKRFLPSEFGMDPKRMEHALEPGNVVFNDKKKVRRAIEAAGIPHTYVSSNIFAGYLAGGLAQLGRLLPPRDEVVIYGDGNVKAVWVDEDDVGIYTLKTINDPRTLNKTVYIRPPQNILSQKELVAEWEQLSGKTLKKTYISAEDFLAGMEGQPYEHQVGISHFYHMFYSGDLYNFEIGPAAREAAELYPEVQYTTMGSYLKRYL